MSNRMDADQARHCVRPDLGPTHLQRLSADDKSCQRINWLHFSQTSDIFHIFVEFAFDIYQEKGNLQSYAAQYRKQYHKNLCFTS